VGYGSALARLLRIRPSIGERGLLGLLCLGFLGATLHFFVPLSAALEIGVTTVGIAASALFFKEIRSASAPGIAAGVFLFVLVIPQAHFGYDDGLYYLQTFRWNSQFHLTPGLGNLHGRLAYNSILFLIAPVIDTLAAGWIANLLATSFVAMSLWTRLRVREPVPRWFALLVLGSFCVLPFQFAWLGVLSSDAFASVLILYWVSIALGFVFSVDRRTDFAMLAAMAALAVAVKVSAAPVLGLTLALYWIYRREALGAARVCSACTVFLAVWIAHGIGLSGCAVYPVRATCISPLPWAVLPAQAELESMAIRAWARKPWDFDYAGVLGGWSWFGGWVRSVAAENFWLRAMLVGIAAGSMASFKRPPSVDLLRIIAGLAGCLVFWFLSAPDPRFGAGYILSTAFLGLAMAASRWLESPRIEEWAPRVLIAIMLVLGLHRLTRVRHETHFYSIPQPEVYRIPTAQGVALWVPRTGDQCWAQPLPCTPYVHPEALKRVRWPGAFPTRTDPKLEPPAGWKPRTSVASHP